MKTGQTGTILGAVVVCALALSACSGNDPDDAGMPKRPIDGYHYNGATDQSLPMTFSAYGMTVPLFEATFACEGAVVAKTSLEAIAIRKSEDGYSFTVSANSLVGYSDEAPDENGTIVVSGNFAHDAATASGDFRIETSRCASGKVTWEATAEPEWAPDPPVK